MAIKRTSRMSNKAVKERAPNFYDTLPPPDLDAKDVDGVVEKLLQVHANNPDLVIDYNQRDKYFPVPKNGHPLIKSSDIVPQDRLLPNRHLIPLPIRTSSPSTVGPIYSKSVSVTPGYIMKHRYYTEDFHDEPTDCHPFQRTYAPEYTLPDIITTEQDEEHIRRTFNFTSDMGVRKFQGLDPIPQDTLLPHFGVYMDYDIHHAKHPTAGGSDTIVKLKKRRVMFPRRGLVCT